MRGYFYWTLQDNYEWNSGMTRTMGLYAVDIKDKTRTKRSGADVYSAISSRWLGAAKLMQWSQVSRNALIRRGSDQRERRGR